MTRMNYLKAALAASVCLLPFQGFAQSYSGPTTNELILGAQYDTAQSAFLNRFTGNNDQGVYGIAGGRYGQRDAWDSGGTARPRPRLASRGSGD
jgi:hypothetical protein